jgi:adenine phosphoribosyltransferase
VDLRTYIRDIPDFPKPGILFRDITPLLKEPSAFQYALDRLAEPYTAAKVDIIVGIESRGFIFGAPLSTRLDAGFVPVRKMGKLPSETIAADYALEYGTNTIEMHRDAILPGQRVLIVDDLLATGGTVMATAQLVEQLGGEVIGMSFLIELAFLRGRDKLPKYNIHTLIEY